MTDQLAKNQGLIDLLERWLNETPTPEQIEAERVSLALLMKELMRPSGPSGGNKLQVWWIPQVPGKPFTVPVASVQEAKKLLDVLALYDIFQYENRIKPDYANAGGLSVFEDGEWTDWYDEEGNDVDSSPLATDGGNK